MDKDENNFKKRSFELADELVEHAEERGYSVYELGFACEIIKSAIMRTALLRSLFGEKADIIADLLLGGDDGEDFDYELERVMEEAEEAINHVD